MREPCIFISSVFKTLEDVREKIHSLVTVDFGWRAWWSEDYQEELQGASKTRVRQVCFNGIENSDFYLAVLPNRYGDDSLGLAFTELEYHHAVSIGIPRVVYQLRDTTIVDPTEQLKQQALLSLLHDREITDPIPVKTSDREQLYRRIGHDLYRFKVKWESGVNLDKDPTVPVRRLLATFQADPLINFGLIAKDYHKFDPDLVRFYLRLMDRTYQDSFNDAIQIGSAILDYMFEVSRWGDAEYLELLNSLLSRWNKAGSWAGIKGTLSPLASAKARMIICQIKKDYDNIYEPAVAIASCYYSDKKLDKALKWSKVAARAVPDYSVSGSVLLALGRIEEAAQSFRRALDKHWKQGSEASFGLNLAHVGLIECKKGNKFDGLNKLRESIDLTATSRGFRARALRALGEGLFATGEITEGRHYLAMAIEHAKRYGLMGQYRKTKEVLASASVEPDNKQFVI